MVLSWYYFQSVEIRWSFLVGTWKTYVRLVNFYAIRFDHLKSDSGLREECTLVRPPLSPPAERYLHTHVVLPSYKTS